MSLFFLLLPCKLSGAPIFSSGFVIFNQVLLYPSMLLYLIAIFAAICCCTPESSTWPDLPFTVFQVFSGILLSIAAFLGFAGASILSSHGFSNSYYLSFSNELQDFIKDPFQTKFNDVKNIYDNNIRSIASTKSLINITNQYNLTFSENTGKYRISFNNIIFNPYASNQLKTSLKEMDKSRNQILSQVLMFAEKYQNCSKFLKNSFNDIIQNDFNSDLNSFQTEKSFHHPKKQIKSVGDGFSAEFSYVLSAGILLLSILYTIFFFCRNKCSRCCFCTYPIYALLIICCAFGTCYYVMKEDYDAFSYVCKNYYSSSDRKIKNEMNLNYNISSIFSEENSEKVEELIQKVSSKSMHNNYEFIYQQYKSNPDYFSDLNQMVSVIKQKDENLLQMKELIENIANYSFSVFSYLSKSQFFIDKPSGNSIKLLKSEKNVLSGDLCGNVLDGMNCCVFGQFLLLAGLFLMFISVCLRRKGMEDYIKVENTQDQYIMGDEIQDIIYFECDEKGIPNSNGKPQSIEDMFPHAPMSLEELYGTEIAQGIWRVYLGTRIVYHATTFEAAQSIIRDKHLIKGNKGMFGPGIYFAATLEIAKHKCRTKVGAYVICKVDFGFAIVYQRPNKTLKLEDIRQYDCDSVMGRSGPGTDWEFIVYESERTFPLQMFRLKQKDEDNHVRSEDEDEEDNNGHIYFGLSTVVI